MYIMYSPLTFKKGDKMAKYTIKKILGMIPMLLIITFIIYWLLDLTPGDPVSYLMDPEALARLTAEQEAADWDDATVMATPFKRMVYLAGDVQILGCMGGLEFAVTLM